jgi:hypothetical protein
MNPITTKTLEENNIIPSALPLKPNIIQTAVPVTETTTSLNTNTNTNVKDSDIKKKDNKIPNSLIIYIKTRIPNFYKINYEPYMSVPKNKSHTVYFDPLIKYYEGPIRNLPSGVPKDTLMTQFFEASEFDSMINRILSDFRYMQKPRTFKQAYDEHIIENNLRITLKNIFKTNTLFYINKRPYTIVGVKSNTSDWQIDKKPLEKLLGQFTHLTLKQLEEEANKEEDDIPEVLRQGNVASSTIADNETASFVAAGLKKAVEEQDKTSLQQEISGVTDSFVHQDELPGVKGDILDLYTKYLRQNTPINYLNTTDLARDPLTLSLLVDSADLLNFINTHKKSSLINLYSAFTNAKITLQQADNSYLDLCKEYAKYKTKFDEEIKIIRRFISNKLSKLTINQQKQETNKLIQQITQLKIGYMEILFKIADSINQIYQLQNVYFITTKELLQGLREDYGNIIQYYEKPELALKCIDNDIDTISSLIEKDPENPYSVSYYTNYKNFKEFYEKQLYKNRQQLLEPQINFADEAEIYIEQPDVLLIEKDQYEIYNFKLLLSYSYNQFDIWVILFKSIEIFITPISKIVSDIIEVADDSKIELIQNYTIDQQNTYLKTIGMEGIRADFDKQSKTLTWHLVKDNGTNAIKSVKRPDGLLLDNLRKQHIKTAKSLKDVYRENEISDKELFQDLYIEYVKTSVKAYDAIVLHIYLLEILCLRQNRVYVAEENVNQLNLEYSLTLENYLDSIVKNINKIKSGTTIHIPPSLLWDTSNLDKISFIESKQKINTKSNIIYRARLKSIVQSRNNLVESCDEISKIITPNISKSGFIKQCSNIINQKLSNITPHTFRSSYWIEQTIKNYDIHATKDFIYNMSTTVKDAWHDRIIEDIDINDYLDWIVFDNGIETGNINSLYATIADGLNRQLEMTDNETTNDYTETINGRQIFTTNSIKELFNDTKKPGDLDDYITNIRVLEETLKIKFIIFEMFPRDSEIYIGDMVLYRGRPNRVISITRTPEDEIVYNLYNGYTKIENVPKKKVKIYPNNPLKNFRIMCNYNPEREVFEFTDYMYIVVTKQEGEDTEEPNLFKFKLVHDTNKKYIVALNDIPIYIKYLIFNSCPNLDRKKLFKMGFGSKQLRDDILGFKDMREQRMENENLRDKMYNINKEIKKTKNEINKLNKIIENPDLKEIQDKSLQEFQDKSLQEFQDKSLQEINVLHRLASDKLTDLKQQKVILKEILAQLDFKPNPKFKPVLPKSVVGGATTLRPSEQYYSNINPYNPTGYSLNPNIPGNVVYLPRQGYPYQGSYYSRQNRVPYNVSQNKAKDQKSKLSFYITIELELFPGTSANIFQKSVVKCQSTFERIREAWADIFGFEYRPAPITEAYSYIYQPVKKYDNKNKTEKKLTTDKNKTRKNRPSK